jgi:tetratricopeptide (TPR) repeat protein
MNPEGEEPTQKQSGAPRAGSLVGRRLGHYEIVSRLGAGGMGEVYLAHDTRLDRQVAVKVMPVRLTSDPESTRRFLREARTAAALDHPNICAIHEVSEDAGRSFIVMQYVEGETLGAKLARERPSWSESLTLAQQIAEALAEAHARRIVHRDIKPANVMITPRGQAKVLDFGLAKSVPAGAPVSPEVATASLLSTPGLVVGTAPYMSPEQVRGDRVDARTDIWSFGVVVYEMLSGKRPFDASTSIETFSAILARDPLPLAGEGMGLPELERLVGKCLEKDPEHRYQTMPELQGDLERARRAVEEHRVEPAQGMPMAATQHASAGGPISAGGRRRSRLALALGAVVTVVLLTAAYVRFFQPGATPPDPSAQVDVASANDDFLRGRVLVSEWNRDSNEQGIALLERAVARDPRLAPAFAELALAYYYQAFFYAPEQAKQINLEAKVAVEKALALDPNLASAHYARGLVLWSQSNRFPHQQAIQSYRRALALDPNLSEAHQALGMVYIHVGLFERARAEIEQALAINPANTVARLRLGVIHLYSGEYEEALLILRGIPRETNASVVDRALAQTYLHLGRLDEASALMEAYFSSNTTDEGGSVTAAQAILHAQRGDARRAEESIRRAIEIGRGYGHFHHTAHNVAAAYALLGRPDDAIEWLKAAAEDGYPCHPCFDNDSFLDGLRDDRRFVDFMAGLLAQQKRYDPGV